MGQSPGDKKKNKNRNILKRAQRVVVIRTSTSYRIAFHTALCVLAVTMSLHLKAELHTESYELRKIGYQERYNTCSRTRGSTSTSTDRARRIEHLMEERWKEEWLCYREDDWTRGLIDNPCIYKDKSGIQITTPY